MFENDLKFKKSFVIDFVLKVKHEQRYIQADNGEGAYEQFYEEFGGIKILQLKEVTRTKTIE